MAAAGPYVKTHRNLFDLVRLTAAVSVLVYHAFPLTGAREPFHDTLGLTLGSVALLALFGISGYLVTASFERDSALGRYAARRALRILPGLVVCSVLTAFVLGALVTSLSVDDYLTRSGPYAYALKQSLLITFNPELPGVFTDNPVAGVVNGSTWTLPIEACCYAALGAAGVAGALRRPRLLLAGLAVLVAVMAVAAPVDSPTGRAPEGVDRLLNALRPCVAFLTGVCLWVVLRDRVPRRPWMIAVAVALLLVPAGVRVHSAIDIVAIPYLAVAIGLAPAGPLRALTARGDVSYGVYIYGYPLQQTLVQALPGISPVALIAMTLPLAWAIGMVSWVAVERRALARKPRRPRAGPDQLPAAPLVEA